MAAGAAGVPFPRTGVNTHHHRDDHTSGNGLFAPEALILGHDSARAGKPEGAPLDIVAVLRDMTVMNGGAPILCHA